MRRADLALALLIPITSWACEAGGPEAPLASQFEDAATPADAAVPGQDAGATIADPHEPGLDGLVPLDPDFTCEPTLDSIREAIFAKTCQWDTCHSKNGAAWGLSLVGTTAELRADLVDRPALGCEGWQLVVPGSPEESLLWNKLAYAKPACGDPMPWGLSLLPAEALSCIEGWIRSL